MGKNIDFLFAINTKNQPTVNSDNFNKINY